MKPIATDVWHAEGDALRLPGGVRMPVSSTVIRLPGRSLLVYSPVAFDAATVAEINAIGEVGHIVAPSLLHHLFVPDAAARWPRALVHGVSGLAARASIDRIVGWPVMAIAPAHGDPAPVSSGELAPRMRRAYGGRVTL